MCKNEELCNITSANLSFCARYFDSLIDKSSFLDGLEDIDFPAVNLYFGYIAYFMNLNDVVYERFNTP